MPKYAQKDHTRNRGVNRKVSYQITFRIRGELNEAYFGAIKDCLLEFLGNVSKSDISIKRVNNNKKCLIETIEENKKILKAEYQKGYADGGKDMNKKWLIPKGNECESQA